MKIYIDDSFICHKTNDDKNLREVEVSFFNGKCDEFINGYRYIPINEVWIRDDGTKFEGEMICPTINFAGLDAIQRLNEKAALRCIGVAGIDSPMVEAVDIREEIDTVIANIDDALAVNISKLFPQWNSNELLYSAGSRVIFQHKLYKCLQDHISQLNWMPDAAPSLWVAISDPAIEWPIWMQPTGAHDAYEIGAKVTHNNTRYISNIAANVTVPGSDPRWWEEQV